MIFIQVFPPFRDKYLSLQIFLIPTIIICSTWLHIALLYFLLSPSLVFWVWVQWLGWSEGLAPYKNKHNNIKKPLSSSERLIFLKYSNVNFWIFVYIQIIDFISFIALCSFSPKSLTKIYIQNTINKEIGIPVNKKRKS